MVSLLLAELKMESQLYDMNPRLLFFFFRVLNFLGKEVIIGKTKKEWQWQPLKVCRPMEGTI